jgi:hypothetical protein
MMTMHLFMEFGVYKFLLFSMADSSLSGRRGDGTSCV